MSEQMFVNEWKTWAQVSFRLSVSTTKPNINTTTRDTTEPKLMLNPNGIALCSSEGKGVDEQSTVQVGYNIINGNNLVPHFFKKNYFPLHKVLMKALGQQDTANSRSFRKMMSCHQRWQKRSPILPTSTSSHVNTTISKVFLISHIRHPSCVPSYTQFRAMKYGTQQHQTAIYQITSTKLSKSLSIFYKSNISQISYAFLHVWSFSNEASCKVETGRLNFAL